MTYKIQDKWGNDVDSGYPNARAAADAVNALNAANPDLAPYSSGQEMT